MKKPVKIVLGVVVGIIVIAAIAGSSNKSNTQTTPNSNSDANAPTAAQPATEKMTIKNSAYKDNGGLKQVVGEITNNDTSEHSATVKATFYAADGSILGTAVGAVNEVAAGQTKTFTLMTTDEVAGYKDMKVQVDTLL